MSKIFTRMGDGSPLEMTESELRQDLEDGVAEAVEKAEVPPLSSDEIQYLVDLFKREDRIVGVEPGKEIVLSYDAATLKIKRHSLFEDRVNCLAIYERLLGADTLELCHVDYSYKPLKPIISYEQATMEQALAATHSPMFYGAMPNLGLYTQPDGPFPNPMELLPMGKIKEGRESYDRMVESAVEDICFIAEAMYESGADGINLDTVGASGDPDFKASLMATERIRAKFPDYGIEMGMAGEFVLGMHGEMFHDGTRLAGLYPRDQLRLAEKAGVSIFGPVVNT
ncbi:MAG: [dimethylamine--corrinoid protein] Co-methyltransferase, partial [Deltaproteobacteria bacterium]|nr:[dimethylamine--corrinoid protein] Co-methyltransferase [Deltaproteobacteria bacterium]